MSSIHNRGTCRLEATYFRRIGLLMFSVYELQNAYFFLMPKERAERPRTPVITPLYSDMFAELKCAHEL